MVSNIILHATRILPKSMLGLVAPQIHDKTGTPQMSIPWMPKTFSSPSPATKFYPSVSTFFMAPAFRIKYGVKMHRWAPCAHASDMSLSQSAIDCENCRLLQHIAGVYYSGVSYPEFLNSTQIRRLSASWKPSQGLTNVVVEWLQASESPGRTCDLYAIVPSWALKRFLNPFLREVVEERRAWLVVHWPFIKIPRLSNRLCWGTTKQSIILRWLRTSCAKTRGDLYDEFPRVLDGTVASSPLPTRLLDLDPESTPKATMTKSSLAPKSGVRLCATPKGCTGRYLTLSHRWGTQHHMKLTKTSLAKLLRAIPFASLPKTYQDAVIVTRSLGYRYLWIDALCIVQDDKLDWSRESQNMAAVYNNSTCTIAPHNALDDQSGFLNEANTHRQKGLATAHNTSDFNTEVRNSILSNRGWVFQETILSKRILHFTDQEVFMEDGSGVKPAHLQGWQYTDYSPCSDNKLTLGDGLGGEGHWYRMVERFTCCTLTYESDRLYAVAGLARHFGDVCRNESYSNGIWGTTAHIGLLWFVDEDTPRRAIADHYDNSTLSSPSWSWGSWSGKIRFPYHLSTCRALCWAESSLSDGTSDGRDMGFQPSAGLTLRAQLYELSEVRAARKYRTGCGLNSFPEELRAPYGLGISWTSWVILDGETSDQVTFEKLVLALTAENIQKETILQDMDDKEDVMVDKITRLYYFLVLREAKDRLGSYERVGIGATYANFSWKDSALEIIHLI